MALTTWIEKIKIRLIPIKKIPQYLWDTFSVLKRKPIFFGLGAFIVFFVILLITVLAINAGKPKKNIPMAHGTPIGAAGFSIPAEDLFLPAEPDYVPEFILEREPRSSWSAEDIRPYWRSPANSEYWRGEIKSAVDKLMEGVP